MSEIATSLTLQDFERLVRWRREIHQYPELGFSEERTQATVMRHLSQLGLSPEPIGKTGVLAILQGSKPGRHVLLRADMDALPIQEANSHDYVSKHDGVMHACGHDSHTAMLMLAAEKLLARRDEIHGALGFLFQPAEEGRGGAEAVIADGLFDRFPADRVAGAHVWSELPTGMIAAPGGPMMAGADEFEVCVRGQGGHGALPHRAKDPVTAAAAIIQSLQTVVSRDVDPLDTAVITVASMESEGSAFNVIPNRAWLRGTVRTFTDATQAMVERRMIELINGMGQAYGVGATVNVNRIGGPVINDDNLAASVRSLAEELTGQPALAQFQTMAAEDFGCYLKDRPGVFWFVGARNEAKHCTYPHHHPKFNIDEDCMKVGAELMIRVALAWGKPS